MNRENLNILLKKAYHQQLSEEEMKVLELWRGEAEENLELYERLMSGQSLTEYSDWMAEFDLPVVMEVIRSKVQRNRQRRIRRFMGWVAACVILCLGFTAVFYFTSMDSELVLMEKMAAQIQPGSAKAILTLGDGRQVALDKKPIELIVNKQQMVTGDSATLNYSIVLPAPETEQIQQKKVAEYHTIEVPAGGEYNLVLADGTKIWLNAESSLAFPVEFVGDKRQVTLKGEAYFEVARNEHLPFVVSTVSGLEICVLGTQFNVEAYDDRESIKTTLVEGSVDVQVGGEKVRLTPRKQLQYHKNTTEMEVREVNVREIIAWKNGWFVFDNTTLGEIVKTLQRWYNIEVEFVHPELEHLHFTGDLSRYDSFDAVVRMFEDTKCLKLSVKDNKLMIDKR